ncbi:MAG: SDR family oxidoreductase [Pseudoruegeria sp.]
MQGKTAIVTGAAKGIGTAIAARFVAEGANVMLNDIDEKALSKVASKLSMPFCIADVTVKDDILRLVKQTVGKFGRIDCLVSNVGGHNKLVQFIDVEEEDFDRVIRLNLKSQFLCGQAVARQMIAQGGGGTIINMSSINARIAIPTLTPYAVAKAGSTQLTNVMAISLGKHNIRVNAIGPGTILDEERMETIFGRADLKNRILSRTPLGRPGKPEEIASVAVFLATDDSSYLTGQTIYPDGGRMGLNLTLPVDE